MKEETAIFAGGCFWCTEAIFRRLKGVTSVMPGYTGGNKPSPSYEDVSSETTGHAEAIQVRFDPSVISYETLLHVFFKTHNPTTLNQQGNDVGTQYRSVIFYHDDNQKLTAQRVIDELTQTKEFSSPIVTEVIPASSFYSAEAYHQRYYETNSYQPYCQLVIDPKIQKLMQSFSQEVKEEYRKR